MLTVHKLAKIMNELIEPYATFINNFIMYAPVAFLIIRYIIKLREEEKDDDDLLDN